MLKPQQSLTADRFAGLLQACCMSHGQCSSRTQQPHLLYACLPQLADARLPREHRCTRPLYNRLIAANAESIGGAGPARLRTTEYY